MSGPMRYLGVDPGGQRMGLAVADEGSGVVSPLAVLPYRGVTAAVATIASRAAEIGAARVVLGLPLAASGEPTPACKRSEQLAAALREAGLDVALQGEYLTTNEARRRAREVGRPRKLPIDDIAAQILLEEYLDRAGAAR